jgi:hypothetical protein
LGLLFGAGTALDVTEPTQRTEEWRMSTKKTAERVVLPDPSARRGSLKSLGGSQSDEFNATLANQAVQGLWLAHADPGSRDQLIQAALAALTGMAPRDELEGMLAAQMAATHSAAMECFRRAMLEAQTFEGRGQNLGHANKLVRSYAVLLEALDRHRGKGQQVVRVEHVTVNAGGQAIVGMVEHPGGGDAGGSEERPRAKAIAHAPEPALRRADPGREPVPVAWGGGRGAL